MTSLEQAFAEAEETARTALASAKRVASLYAQLVKATQTGDLAGMRRIQRTVEAALETLRGDATEAEKGWRVSPEEEEHLYQEKFEGEFQKAVHEVGLKVFKQGENLIVYPSIVRPLPAERAVRVDRKKVSAARPSHLADLLLKKSEKAGGSFPSERFLETLYQVYSELTFVGRSDPDLAGTPTSLHLSKIYRVLTALPGARRNYDASDFARDLYILDTNGPRQTRRGAAVNLKPPSSAARSPSQRDLFTFVGPEGNEVRYYQIEFQEG